MAEISVIIPTLKPRAEVECLEYLDASPFSDYEVCLQDEPTATSARNAGIERASADKLVFLDDDSRPRESYLSGMAELLNREAAVAGRTVHPRNDIFGRHFTEHYDFGDRPRYITRFWGCNMGIHRNVFDAIGGWDENISWGHEEIELAERVLTVSPIYYDPNLVVDHPYADSVSDYLSKIYRQERQQPYLWDKQGYSTREQVFNILGDVLNPMNYLGLPVAPALLHGAGTIARAGGRLSGMLQDDPEPEGRREGSPAPETNRPEAPQQLK